MEHSIYNFVSSYSKYKEIYYKNDPDENSIKEICEEYIISQIDPDEQQGRKVGFMKVCPKVKNYLNYIKENSKSLDIPKCCKYLNYLLYDQAINNLLSGYTTLSLYSDLQKIYDENSFDLILCNEHKEYVKYETYIKINELITLYQDFNAYNASNEPKEDNECNCVRKCANSYKTYIMKCEDGTQRNYCDALEEFRNTYNQHMQSGTKCKNVDIYLPSTKKVNIIVLITIPSIIILSICFLLFILYKFTTLCPCINDQKKKRKNMKESLNQEIPKLKSKTNISHQNDGNRKYHIAYHT
ncbi:PIR protein [Plasmodium vivax]|nr:PIR protein [Plasmodium vivax]